jgi:hypothetical protein
LYLSSRISSFFELKEKASRVAGRALIKGLRSIISGGSIGCSLSLESLSSSESSPYPALSSDSFYIYLEKDRKDKLTPSLFLFDMDISISSTWRS